MLELTQETQNNVQIKFNTVNPYISQFRDFELFSLCMQFYIESFVLPSFVFDITK